MVQTTKQVVQWGNSLGVRISKAAAARAGIERGSSVHIKAEPGKITLVPTKPRWKHIDELIGRITPENLNRDEEFLNAPPVGREII